MERSLSDLILTSASPRQVEEYIERYPEHIDRDLAYHALVDLAIERDRIDYLQLALSHGVLLTARQAYQLIRMGYRDLVLDVMADAPRYEWADLLSMAIREHDLDAVRWIVGVRYKEFLPYIWTFAEEAYEVGARDIAHFLFPLIDPDTMTEYMEEEEADRLLDALRQYVR
jgi:hypothetical protein